MLNVSMLNHIKTITMHGIKQNNVTFFPTVINYSHKFTITLATFVNFINTYMVVITPPPWTNAIKLFFDASYKFL